jgi:transketolase
MRNAFVKALEKEALCNDKLILLVGDIGFGVFERFQEDFPKRFINMGIAEQNMVSVASGLAKEGYFPVVYTIIPFLTMRAFEQIRVDVCLHDRNLLLGGVGGGYSYDILGPTHHALEDLALMRALPNMKIFTPSAPSHIESIANEVFKSSGPKYLRLGKNGEKELDKVSIYDSQIGAYTYGSPSELIFVSHGPISEQVEYARAELASRYEIEVKHQVVIRNEPASIELFRELNKPNNHVYFVEEIYSSGSLYSQFLLFAMENPTGVQVRGIHAPHNFYHSVADRLTILSDLGLDYLSIANFVSNNEKNWIGKL